MFKMFRVNLSGTQDTRGVTWTVMRDIIVYGVTETDAVVSAVSLAIQEGYVLCNSCLPLVLYTPAGNLKRMQQPAPNMSHVGVWMVRLYDTFHHRFVHNVLSAKGEADAIQTSILFLTQGGRRLQSDFKMSVALPFGSLPERMASEEHDGDAFLILDSARHFLDLYMAASAERTRETIAQLPNS